MFWMQLVGRTQVKVELNFGFVQCCMQADCSWNSSIGELLLMCMASRTRVIKMFADVECCGLSFSPIKLAHECVRLQA